MTHLFEFIPVWIHWTQVAQHWRHTRGGPNPRISMHFCNWRSLCSQTPFYQVFGHILQTPGDFLYLKKYLLRTFHTCSSLCFVPLPPLQCYLGQKWKINKEKGLFWEPSCVTSGFASCLGRLVRTLWGRKGQVRGRKPLTLCQRGL